MRAALVVGVVILGFFVGSAPAARVLASPPSVVMYVVDPPGLAGMIGTHFGEPAAARALGELTRHVDVQPQLINPYRAPFVAVRDELTVLSILAGLWKDANGREDPREFKAFLAAVNQAPLVRGMVRTSAYRGCVIVRFSLADEGGRPFLDARLAAFRFRGCGPTYGSRFRTGSRLALE
jgi:hypothetical protein